MCHALAVVAAFVSFVQCAHAQTAAVQPIQIAQTTDEKVRTLKSDYPEAQVQLDAGGERIRRLIRLDAPDISDGTAESIARSVLGKDSVASALGLSRDLRELCNVETRNDPQLANHAIVRMRQCVGKVRVLGAELVMSVRLGPSPRIDMLTSSLASGLPESQTPKITAAAARLAAEAAVKKLQPNVAVAELREVVPPAPPELVVFDPILFGLQGQPRLCWLVSTRLVATIVDASNGTVLHQYSELVRTR